LLLDNRLLHWLLNWLLHGLLGWLLSGLLLFEIESTGVIRQINFLFWTMSGLELISASLK
jgi:hypothetical protein